VLKISSGATPKDTHCPHPPCISTHVTDLLGEYNDFYSHVKKSTAKKTTTSDGDDEEEVIEAQDDDCEDD